MFLYTSYNSCYVSPLPEGHRFPMPKFGILRDILLRDGITSEHYALRPEQATLELLSLVHKAEYIQRFTNNELTTQEIRRVGLPWSESLVVRTKTALMGTVIAAEKALEVGIACNGAGGTHHAFADFGSGFCIVNDLAVTAKHLTQQNGLKKVLIIDVDVHQGDGTAALLQNDTSCITFSVHCKSNFPFTKQQSDYDIELADGVGDEEYMRIIAGNVPALLDEIKPDFVLYDAGVDVYEGDPLGKLSLTLDGIYQRDLFILSECGRRAIPVCGVIGGGYSKDYYELAYRHSLLHRAAKEVLLTYY